MYSNSNYTTSRSYRFKLAQVYTSPEEFSHYLLPKEDAVDTFVIKDAATGKVTDVSVHQTV